MTTPRCAICGQVLTRTGRKYCSRSCACAGRTIDARSKWPLVVCERCGMVKAMRPRAKARGPHRFCSQGCFRAARAEGMGI